MIFHQTFNSRQNYFYDPRLYHNFHIVHHFHNSFELIYLIDGELELNIDARTERIKKHEFALILPNQIHAADTVGASSRCWVGVFSKEFVYEFFKLVDKKVSERAVFICPESIRCFIEQELISEKPPNLLLLKALLYSVCSAYIEQIPLIPIKQNNKTSSQIIQFIAGHFQEQITLNDLANELGYEYHYTSRCFYNLFHTNFKSFLNQYRCEHAKMLLLRENMNITAVSLECGFQSIRNFNRVFKEYTKVAPRDYVVQVLQEKTNDIQEKAVY